jgi:hypothetical protein
LDSTDEEAHCHGEERRQDSVNQHDRPPRKRKTPVGRRQDREELPLLSVTQALTPSHSISM